MLPANPYRKLVIESYYYMLTIHFGYSHVAMDICLLDELKILDGFMEGETFHQDVFDSIKDPAVQTINRFLKETKVILNELEDANHILDEEIDEFDDPERPAYEDKADKLIWLCVLLLYSDHMLAELTHLIDDLCELNGEPPITDFGHIDFYEDENVRYIATFYQKVMEFTDEVKEHLVRENEEKENRES